MVNTSTVIGNVPVDLENAKTLKEFLDGRFSEQQTPADPKTPRPLCLNERRAIVEEAIRVLEGLYVHLQYKCNEYNVNPINELHELAKVLQPRPETGNVSRDPSQEIPPDDLKDDLGFHRKMIRIFNSVRDLHTSYVPPPPFDKAIAMMPFQIEECFDEGRHQYKYIVTNIIEEPSWNSGLPPDFRPGVEITHWHEHGNDKPIAEAVEQSGKQSPGGNDAARHALGIDRLTTRPLAKMEPPDPESVNVKYIPLSGGQPRPLLQPLEWRMATLGDDPNEKKHQPLWRATGEGLDFGRECVRQVRRAMHREQGEQRLRKVPDDFRCPDHAVTMLPAFSDKAIPGGLPVHCEAKKIKTSSEKESGQPKEYGYIRIRSFRVAEHRSYLRQFARLLDEMPPNGLIIDVRDNPGGLILAAERLLQLLTLKSIEPEEMQFVDTPLSCKVRSVIPEYLERRKPDAVGGTENATQYSDPEAISSPVLCNNVGQRYCGPVVLITNALSYSATEIFAAGFQDHRIGKVLGTDKRTGGGGANVVRYSTLIENFDAAKKAAETVDNKVAEVVDSKTTEVVSNIVRPERPFENRLPDGVDLRVAIRRALRVGKPPGTSPEDRQLEDRGVVRDECHTMTLHDLMCDNVDLLAKAVEILEKENKPPYQLKHKILSGKGDDPVTAEITTSGIDRLDVSLNEASHDVKDGPNTITVTGRPARLLTIRGHRTDKDGETLVAMRKVKLVQPGPPKEQPELPKTAA